MTQLRKAVVTGRVRRLMPAGRSCGPSGPFSKQKETLKQNGLSHAGQHRSIRPFSTSCVGRNPSNNCRECQVARCAKQSKNPKFVQWQARSK
jgi:hypothetical protein